MSLKFLDSGHVIWNNLFRLICNPSQEQEYVSMNCHRQLSAGLVWIPFKILFCAFFATFCKFSVNQYSKDGFGSLLSVRFHSVLSLPPFANSLLINIVKTALNSLHCKPQILITLCFHTAVNHHSRDRFESSFSLQIFYSVLSLPAFTDCQSL